MARDTIRNGLNVQQLSQLIAAIKANPEIATVQVQAHAQWQGGGRSIIALSPASEDGGSDELPPTITADSLSTLAADGSAPNAGQLLLAALASDLVACFVRIASERDVRIETLDAKISGLLQLRHQFGLPGAETEALGGMSVHLSVDADCAPEDLHEAWREAQRTSTMLWLVRASTPISLHFEVSRRRI
jgi:uncharacterized OsmC-like protein